MPGQLYVACSWASTKEGLKIVGFNKNKLFKQDSHVTDFFANLTNSKQTLSDNLACCRNIDITTEPADDLQFEEEVIFDTMSESELLEVEKSCNELFIGYSENTLNAEENSLDDILKKLKFDNVSQFPAALDEKKFLEELKNKSDVCTNKGNESLREKINCLLSDLQNKYLHGVCVFLQLYWAQIAGTFSKRMKKIQD